MDDLNHYGPALFRYEGMGEVSFENGDVVPVYFDARQLNRATVVIGCMAEGWNLGASSRIISRISGLTTDGHELESVGRVQAISTSVGSSKPAIAQLVCQDGLKLELVPSKGKPIHLADFGLLNFCFHEFAAKPVDGLTKDFLGFNFAFVARDDYRDAMTVIRRVGAPMHSADCQVSKYGGSEFEIKDATSGLQELLMLAQLDSGSKVNWAFYNAFDKHQWPVERFHAPSVIRPFSNVVLVHEWWVDLSSLIDDYIVHRNDLLVSPQELAIRIDHYCDASSTQVALETRGLSAATLLDSLANRHAELTNSQYVLPEEEWEEVEPRLQRLMSGFLSGERGVTGTQREQLLSSLKGANRRTFRNRLRNILKDLEVPVSKQMQSDIVDYRNALVHSGRFSSANRELWTTELWALLWTCRSILLRLSGYQGALPSLGDLPR